MNNNAEKFWQRVKELIKLQKTTQEWVANTAGVSFSNFKQQIFHNRMPTADEAVGIAKALNTKVEYLVTGVVDDCNNKAVEMLQEVIKILS